MTRLGMEMKHLRMQLESLTGRLEFTERRARAVEGAVAQGRPSAERPVIEFRPEPQTQQTPQSQQTQQTPQTRRTPASADTPAESQVGAAAEPAASSQDARSTRSRRRRRRRGRRGSGGASVAEGGDPQAGQGEFDGADAEGPELDASEASGPDPVKGGATGVESAGHFKETVSPRREVPPHQADGRTARPEPFEHTFGAQAHPAEPTAADPTARGTSGEDILRASEPTAVTPRATTES
jgi:hypothetical protein